MAEPAPALRADAERNRQRLLAAARELFAERGADVTLDDIARHAGVGVGTAYRRFPNKEAVIDELVVEQIDAMTAAAERSLDAPDAISGLRGYLEASAALQLESRALKEVLFSPGRGLHRVQHAREKLAPAVGRLVDRGKAEGVLRDDVLPSDVALINLMLSVAIDFGRDRRPELFRRYLEPLLAGLRRDAPQPPEPAMPMELFQEAMAEFKFGARRAGR